MIATRARVVSLVPRSAAHSSLNLQQLVILPISSLPVKMADISQKELREEITGKYEFLGCSTFFCPLCSIIPISLRSGSFLRLVKGTCVGKMWHFSCVKSLSDCVLSLAFSVPMTPPSWRPLLFWSMLWYYTSTWAYFYFFRFLRCSPVIPADISCSHRSVILGNPGRKWRLSSNACG